MKNISIWNEYVKKSKNETKIFSKENADVLIIGAGIIGLTTAINLINSNKKVIVIDKGSVGKGITSASTGKLSLNQGICYSKIEKLCGYDTAYKYYKSQKCSLKLIDSIIKKYNIDCDYTNSSSTTFIDSISSLLDLDKEETFYKKAKIKYSKVSKLNNNYKIISGLEIKNMHVFNPVKYLNGLKIEIVKKIPIYENIIALSIKRIYGKYKVRTNKGEIIAKKIIVATHYPFFISPGFIHLKTYIEKSYMLAATVNKSFNMNAISANRPIMSMRYYNDFLIIAANSHTTKDSDNYEASFNDLKKKFYDNFKGEIKYIWSNHDVMTNDGLPYIGEIDNNLFIATGFNKWGLSCSGIAAKLLSDLINKTNNEFSEIFKINRKGSIITKFNTFKHNYNITKTYINMKLTKKTFKKVTYKKILGKDIAIYKNGKHVYKVLNKCPHMGCKLLFNQNDLTWDCPCHGSRFDLEGECICGPSTYSIKVKEKNK